MRQHIVETIRAHARSIPRKYALADSRVRIRYAGLDAFSSRMAVRLLALGCEPGARVAMVAQRKASVVAAILGTFRAGCIHVPIDPHMPSGRLRYVLSDIAPAVVIVDDDLRETVVECLDAGANILLVSEIERLLAVDETEIAPTCGYAPGLEAPAYCIYTSGSTGHPKGVLIDHRSIADFFDGAVEAYDVTAQAVCASFSPLHFDVFLMDMLLPIAQGALLYVYDDVVVPDLMFKTIRACAVTHFSAWGMMLGLIAQASDFAAAPLPRLRTILTGTDVPDVKTVQLWLAKNTDVRVINAYGPTEATCAATAHVIREREPDRQELYPIGKPLKHVTTVLVGHQGQRIDAPDLPGELLISGSQLMKGYWNQPEETAARLSRFEGTLWYRTGDICTYLADGSLYYVGRSDHEVNIGGYRVHVNEPRRVINSVPHVHDSEIVMVETEFGEKVLAAGVLLDMSQNLDVEQHLQRIRRRLADELPGYMVPRYLMALENFPLLSSGKTDRKRLLSVLKKHIDRPIHEVITS